jgi:putative endonuclease
MLAGSPVRDHARPLARYFDSWFPHNAGEGRSVDQGWVLVRHRSSLPDALLKSRLKLHHSGLVTSTKRRRPLELIFYEAYLNEYDAKRQESYFKTSKGWSSLKTMLAEFLKGTEGPSRWDEETVRTVLTHDEQQTPAKQ